MMGKTHRLGGIMVATAMLTAIPQDPLIIAGTVACSLAGSYFPDLDHRNSTASRKAKIVGTITSTIFTHRGFMHWPSVYTVLYLIGLYFAPLPYSVLLTGWYFGVLSHLSMDLFNPQGIPLLAPFSMKKISFGNITTGSAGETIFRILLTIAAVAFGFMVFWNAGSDFVIGLF